MTRELPAWAREVAEQLAHPERTYVNGLWSNPPGSLIERIYAEAKKVYPRQRTDIESVRQARLRRIHIEFHRRLRAAGIYVETQEGL